MVQTCSSLLALLDAGIYSIYDVHIPLPSKGVQMIWPRNVGGEVMNDTGTKVYFTARYWYKSTLVYLLYWMIWPATSAVNRIESAAQRTQVPPLAYADVC
jgi:hypothetical protein